MQALECRVPPLVQVAATALLMWWVSGALPALDFYLPGALWWGLIPGGAGLAIVIAGLVAFRRAHTTADPTAPEQSSALVTTGVYRFSRNPMYLGFLCGLLGWGLYCQNGAALLLLPVFVLIMNRLQIRPEERIMLARFGHDFRRYRERVRRWL